MYLYIAILLIIGVLIYTAIILKKRYRKTNSFKSLLTHICFLLIVILNILAPLTNIPGLLRWSLTFILLILGAYFTKYFPEFKKRV